MKTICKLVGGSHLYGLNTPASDYDERYVFMHDELARTIGLDRFEHLDERGGEQDKFGFELRHYLAMLRKTNTQVLEILFADNYIDCHPLFKSLIIDNRKELIDVEKLHKSLKGYMHGEKELANGQRTGTLGKRKDALIKYGFSPKNFVQLIRLGYVGVTFFKTGVYPVRIIDHDKGLAEYLMALKTTPEKFKLAELNKLVDGLMDELDKAFDKRVINYAFNFTLANEILLEFYFPVLARLYGDLKLK